MATRRNETRQKILDVARDLVRRGGPASLTYDAVAQRLGISKQAVIYWFPSKEALVADVALPLLAEEARVAADAVAGKTGAEAIASFVQAVGSFHLSDLDRFRLMYVAPQLGERTTLRLEAATGARIHATTAELYAALEKSLARQDDPPGEARRRAVALHMAALGLALLAGLADAADDPLAHAPAALLDALAAMLANNHA